MPDITELGELLDQLFALSEELFDKGDWAASKALDEILSETWINEWYRNDR